MASIIRPMSDRRDADIRIRFGQAVRKRRQELGISQEDLAALAGMHRTYLGDIERGKRNVALVNVERLAAALNVPIAALFE